ncbi:hypothetical protein GPA10_39330 [Streptomyces sp. p1417]|uniref:Uncharacterized protein n=1 Tax=Streptomyces typhae TaxID=2681492 RepID=A0A6L6XA10_9ACTN|nr:hypothetical protein [Streptomyces typhae]MVO90646.1 hypothetical protein [Streptomyces typhae]
MSLWLKLTKIEPPLLEEARRRPDLIEALFSSEDESRGEDEGERGGGVLPPTFRPGADSWATDHRLISAVATDRAEVEEGTADWTRAYPWLARSTGEGPDVIEAYESGYGPAFVLTPAEVRAVAEGLTAEGWAAGATAAHWKGDRAEGGIEDLGPFFAAAVAEAKAVIGRTT